jgi:hypothetical protein
VTAIVLVVTALLLLGSGLAYASDHVYHDADAALGVYVTSGIDDITGGYAESCFFCGVEIRTTTDFYPYYVYASASSVWYVSLSHSVEEYSRSRCKTYNPWYPNGGGGDDEHLYCYYTT